MVRHDRYAGGNEVYKALVAEGFPEDVAGYAVNATVYPDDDPRYMGWTKHLPDARSHALALLRSKIETYDFDILQLRRQIEEKHVERTALAAAMEKLAPTHPASPS